MRTLVVMVLKYLPELGIKHFQNTVFLGGKQLKTYDPFSRNPLFCGAEHTNLWELRKVKQSQLPFHSFRTASCFHGFYTLKLNLQMMKLL